MIFVYWQQETGVGSEVKEGGRERYSMDKIRIYTRVAGINTLQGRWP
jgi:hypothetical protein